MYKCSQGRTAVNQGNGAYINVLRFCPVYDTIYNQIKHWKFV